MKIQRFLPVILALLVWMGCEDDKNGRSPEITVGNYKDMIVEPQDILLAGSYYRPVYSSIDLNNNGIDDIQFESVIYGSQALGGIPLSTVRALHDNVGILGFHTYDTIFTNKTIVINEDVSPVEVYEKIIKACHRTDDSDYISSIKSVFKILPLYLEESISIDDVFESDTIGLKRSHWSMGGSEQVGDTLFRFVEHHNTDCSLIPEGEYIYMGVKLMDESRLGWIKIKVQNFYLIHISEIAIQE